MNTIEDAKKAKWLIKLIQKRISEMGIKNVSIKYTSLFLEEDEDVKIYEDIIEQFAFDSDFEEIILFVAIVENEGIQCTLRVPDNKKATLELWKKSEDDSISSNLSWKEGLNYILRAFIRQQASVDEQYQYLFKSLEPHGYI